MSRWPNSRAWRTELVSLFYEDLSVWDALSASVPTSLASAAKKRRREFAAGRQCAYTALHRAGCPIGNWLSIGNDQLPVWPHGWLGSISHSERGAVAAVSRNDALTLLGIDIERLQDDQPWLDIQDLIVCGDELTVLSSLALRRQSAWPSQRKNPCLRPFIPQSAPSRISLQPALSPLDPPVLS